MVFRATLVSLAVASALFPMGSMACTYSVARYAASNESSTAIERMA